MPNTEHEHRMIYKCSEDYFVRQLADSDLEGPWPGWFQNQQVCKYNGHGKLFKSKAYYRRFLDDINREDQIIWAVCHTKDGHIGNVSLQQMSLINRTAEFAIILGDPRHWGKGVGSMVGLQLLKHGFNKLNLERIFCGTAATNVGMIKLATTLGMKHEGTRRQHLFLEGVRVDMVEFGILRSEFQAY